MPPVTSFSAEVEVELSREEPTLGSLLLTFYIIHQLAVETKYVSQQGRRELATYEVPRQERDEIHRNERPHNKNARLELRTFSRSWLS